jgi:hypothetical protein
VTARYSASAVESSPRLPRDLPGDPAGDAIAQEAHLHLGHRLEAVHGSPLGELPSPHRVEQQAERLRTEQLRSHELVAGRHRDAIGHQM